MADLITSLTRGEKRWRGIYRYSVEAAQVEKSWVWDGYRHGRSSMKWRRSASDPADLHHRIPGGSFPAGAPRPQRRESGNHRPPEFFIGGREIGNGFCASELNDAEDQARSVSGIRSTPKRRATRR